MSALSAKRPSQRESSAPAPHVEKARAAVAGAEAEKKIPLLAPPKYHRGLQEIKSLCTSSTAVKHLLLEAIEDLFEKYKAGEGRFEVDDLEELKRRLEKLEK